MFLLDRGDYRSDVDVSGVLDCGEGVGGVFLTAEKGESFFCPGPCEVAHLFVSVPDVFHTFCEQSGALVVQGHNVRDGGRGWGLVFLCGLCEVEEVEVVASAGDGFAFFEGAAADGGDGETRREREGLLDGAESDVPAEPVEVERQADHTADGVNEDEDIGIFFLHQVADFIDGVCHAGACLVVDKRYGGVFAGG